jgi:hypothetical protein
MKLIEKYFFVADFYLGYCLRLGLSCIWVNMIGYTTCYISSDENWIVWQENRIGYKVTN